MTDTINWELAIQPLLKAYKGTKHPLNYKNTYQLLVAVVLSAQDADKHINAITPKLFDAYPNIQTLSHAMPDDLFPYVSKVRNFGNKINWLLDMAKQVKNDKNIPTTMEGLIALPGIGRKSANVIMRGAGANAEGIIVDLHVVRVAPRLGIATGTNPINIEKQMMQIIPQKNWEIGMAMSFLGREICRPTNPNHDACVLKNVCSFYKENK